MKMFLGNMFHSADVNTVESYQSYLQEKHCFIKEELHVFLVTPHRNCRLKLLKLERIKDFLLLEEEFIQNQERLKPQEEKNEVSTKYFQSFFSGC